MLNSDVLGPFHRASAEEVNRRVAYHLVRIAFRDVPRNSIPLPASAVYDLACLYKELGFGYLYWSLQWYARNLLSDHTMRDLRDLGPDNAHRALHKRRVAARAR